MTVYELWLPILIAGLATHILSTIFWTVSPHHKPEWNVLPIEDDLIDLLDSKQVPANQYIFPFARTPDEMKDVQYQSKMGKCRGMLILWPSPPNMGAAIGKTLAFFFIAAFSVGYVASLGLEKGDTFAAVFRFVATVALLTHVYAKFPHVFWFQRQIGMEVLDGVVYAIATGLIFAAMWPAA